MREKVKLEVGDVLFGIVGFRSDVLVKCAVKRVTNTQAIIGEGTNITRFDREVFPTHFYAKGSTTYSRTLYMVATPELDREYVRQRLLYKISLVDLKTLKSDALAGVLRIITDPSNMKEMNNA